MIVVKRLLSCTSSKASDKPEKSLEPKESKVLATVSALRRTGRFDRPSALNEGLCMFLCKPFETWIKDHEDLILSRAHFINLEDAEYALIKPAKILFEKLVTTPRALIFWHALLYSPRAKIKDINNKTRHRFTTSKQSLSALSTNRIYKRLSEVSKHLIIILAEKNGKEVSGDGVTFNLAQDSHKKCTTTAINFHALDLLISKPAMTLIEQKKHYLRLALILTHEFAHAFQLIHNSSWDNEEEGDPFFQNDGFGELGFALLNWLLGGDAGYQVPNTKGCMMRIAGTNEMWEKYERAGTPFAISERLPGHRQWRVEDDVVERLFTKKLWKEEVVLSEGDGLRGVFGIKVKDLY